MSARVASPENPGELIMAVGAARVRLAWERVSWARLGIVDECAE